MTNTSQTLEHTRQYTAKGFHWLKYQLLFVINSIICIDDDNDHDNNDDDDDDYDDDCGGDEEICTCSKEWQLIC